MRDRRLLSVQGETVDRRRRMAMRVRRAPGLQAGVVVATQVLMRSRRRCYETLKRANASCRSTSGKARESVVPWRKIGEGAVDRHAHERAGQGGRGGRRA